MLDTAVLYITFARPEYARKSFEAIRKVKPKKLYFYNNKARSDKPDEIFRNQEVRDIVKMVDWDCELKLWFREKYVDVFTSLWGAIDWVFDNEKKAIIVEEDVVISGAFVNYASRMLDVYRNDATIWMISGNNAAPEYVPEGIKCLKTRFADIYGWASWSDRWKRIDRNLSFWPEFRKSNEFRTYCQSFLQFLLQRYYFDKVYRRISEYNPWDYIFFCNVALNRGLNIIPSMNLCADIGSLGANHQVETKNRNGIICPQAESFCTDDGTFPVLIDSFDRRFYFKLRILDLLRRKVKLVLCSIINCLKNVGTAGKRHFFN